MSLHHSLAVSLFLHRVFHLPWLSTVNLTVIHGAGVGCAVYVVWQHAGQMFNHDRWSTVTCRHWSWTPLASVSSFRRRWRRHEAEVRSRQSTQPRRCSHRSPAMIRGRELRRQLRRRAHSTPSPVTTRGRHRLTSARWQERKAADGTLRVTWNRDG